MRKPPKTSTITVGDLKIDIRAVPPARALTLGMTAVDENSPVVALFSGGLSTVGLDAFQGFQSAIRFIAGLLALCVVAVDGEAVQIEGPMPEDLPSLEKLGARFLVTLDEQCGIDIADAASVLPEVVKLYGEFLAPLVKAAKRPT